MLPLKGSEIFGNWGTLLLPVNEDQSIDYKRLEKEIEVLIEMGVDGIYSNGTAGEFYNQTEEEFEKINLLLSEMCHKANMSFQLGCSHVNPVMGLDRIKKAVKMNPGAIQVILPDWSAPSMPEVIDYLKLVSEVAFPIGLVLYNPPHAKKVLRPEEFLQIRDSGVNMVGCKVAGGDKNWYAAMRQMGEDFSIFVPGHLLATGIMQGAKGAYSNVACLHPGFAQHWYETMLTNMEEALEVQARIQYFMEMYILPFIKEKGYSNQAADKLLAAIGGWANIGTRLRWPYQGIPEQEVEPLRMECIQLFPGFFEGSVLIKE